jgi:undecaprenyl-diphosphatase
MSIWALIVLCVVQGLTEFLPVSSSGHLLFFEQVFGITEKPHVNEAFLS